MDDARYKRQKTKLRDRAKIARLQEVIDELKKDITSLQEKHQQKDENENQIKLKHCQLFKLSVKDMEIFRIQSKFELESELNEILLQRRVMKTRRKFISLMGERAAYETQSEADEMQGEESREEKLHFFKEERHRLQRQVTNAEQKNKLLKQRVEGLERDLRKLTDKVAQKAIYNENITKKETNVTSNEVVVGSIPKISKCRDDMNELKEEARNVEQHLRASKNSDRQESRKQTQDKFINIFG